MPYDAARFDPAPSRRTTCDVTVAPDDGAPAVDAVAVLLAVGQEPPAELGVGGPTLAALRFGAKVGETLVVPRADGPPVVLAGLGERDGLGTDAVRDAAAAVSRAVPAVARIALPVPDVAGADVEAVATALVEGAVLARYSFSLRGKGDPAPALEHVVLTAPSAARDAAGRGGRRGLVTAQACALARDLATCPGGILTATRMADLAVEVGKSSGLSVEVFERDALQELGCGGLLGVNQGSSEEPRMVRLRYEPVDPTGRLTLVGKGIMYDSGGISLKPSDSVHATMKNDMSGAAAVLAAMSTLQVLGCRTAVTGYLMCTDNMPSGTAMQMGDVLTIRGGTTVEVLNTDAEGRLVMADALVLATEEPTDAIVDIATLTGACMRALGTRVAGLMGNDDALMAQVVAAGKATDEPVWILPTVKAYRPQMDSDVADLNNLGGPNAGAITAALFLEEFVAGRPWAHVDIAGTAQADAAQAWRPKGPTGFGTRLLVDLALAFRPPTRG